MHILRSMTGFGTGTGSNGALSVTIEIKAVNQRFLELSIHMPHAYLALEDRLRKAVKAVLHRGKADIYVSVSELTPQEPQIRIDYANLEACKRALDEANQRLFQRNTSLEQIASLTKDWFIQEPPAVDTDAAWPVFYQALGLALDGISSMRATEGLNIRTDLLERAGRMEGFITAVEGRKAEILQAYENRLRARIAKLFSDAGAVPDESRLLQEVAVYADKTDFTEEVVRFRSHMLQLRRLLEEDGDIGRKLDFLIQEMNREVNTIGSKASDLDATQYVLKLKNEIEKIREQVQNIE